MLRRFRRVWDLAIGQPRLMRSKIFANASASSASVGCGNRCRSIGVMPIIALMRAIWAAYCNRNRINPRLLPSSANSEPIFSCCSSNSLNAANVTPSIRHHGESELSAASLSQSQEKIAPALGLNVLGDVGGPSPTETFALRFRPPLLFGVPGMISNQKSYLLRSITHAATTYRRSRSARLSVPPHGAMPLAWCGGLG